MRSVRTNGQFVIRATLRSAFSDDGDLVLPAAGRYAVASIEGGNATVYGIATQDTHVSLAQPKFVLARKPGGKLHFAVRVPGADRHVRVAIKLGNKTLAQGLRQRARPLLQDDRQAVGQGQPACGGLRAGRGHRHLRRHAAEPIAPASSPVAVAAFA